jgi:HD-like signal output (HDOD) protein
MNKEDPATRETMTNLAVRRPGENAQDTVGALLERMQTGSDFPAISQYISEINEKASPKSLTTAAQLANIIIKDYSLTIKLLKIVNSALYGQFSGQIATISRAVVILGFEKVRLAATSLIFFKHMQNCPQADEIKKVILTSFLSAFLARDIAVNLGVKEAEDIFICAMLHNFGRLLMMYYFPEEYRESIKLMAEENLKEPDATRKVFGTSFDEIGMEVTRTWGFPQTILSSMKNLSPQELYQENTVIEMHRSLACFANELYDIAAGDISPKEKGIGLQSLLSKYQKIIPFSEKKIAEQVEVVNQKAKEYFDVLHFGVYQERLLQQLNFRSKPKIEQKTSEGPQHEPDITAQPLDLHKFHIQESPLSSTSSAKDEEDQLLIMNGIQDVTNALLEDGCSLDDVINMVVETMYRGLGFSRVLVLIKDPKENTMNGRFGLGQYVDEIIRKFKFKIENTTDVFNLALMEGKDIYIDNTEDPEVTTSIPDWYRGILKAPAFVLFPININKNNIGLLYADMKGSDKPIATEKLSYMKTLRNQIVLAIKQKTA